ncbi:MAG: sulfatase-like hydrolase/transferase [Rickettsiales bacterium]|jgi:lipid A ethanolaminephosphotransferase|nr:sulfatase-like hydrolase/transferase [Rickettsiales bacterium]
MGLSDSRSNLFGRLKHWKIRVPRWAYVQLFTLTNLLLYSRPFFAYLLQKRQLIVPWAFYPTVVLFYLFFAALLNIAFLIILRGSRPKVASIVILLVNSVCLHFMNLYRIQIDVYMIMNVFGTNGKEAADLITLRLFLNIFLLGILPSIFLIKKVDIDGENFAANIKLGLASLALAALLLIPSLLLKGSYRFIKRENRYTLNYLIPANYICGTIGFFANGIKKSIFERNIISIGDDARIEYGTTTNGKKNIVVVIVGESARSDNFSLNGYSRKTNEPLERFKIISYRNAYSCGTCTKHSVACMFSHRGRLEFDPLDAKRYESILDIFSRLKFDVMWLSNNGNCKGVCDRVRYMSTRNLDRNDFDRSLTLAFKRILGRLEKQNNIVVLNQRGSHDPYRSRYPAEMEKFKPVCNGSLDQCPYEEVLNAYDNSIYYTSQNIGDLLDLLIDREDEYNSVLIYMSDHGEGLGEDGILAHSMPYDKANDYVKKIPMLLWFSDGFLEEFHIDYRCLERMVDDRLSHDNLFHSLLGLFGVKSRYYIGDLDIFKNCRVAK